MFRVLGSPYTLVLHQHVAYLRLKRLPFRLHCANVTATVFHAFRLRARGAFATVTPAGATALQLWQLVERVELEEGGGRGNRGPSSEGTEKCNRGPPSEGTEKGNRGPPSEGRGKGKTGGGGVRVRRMLLDKRTHPRLHLAAWAVVVYACWWLARSAAMFRWMRGDGLAALAGYVRYFCIIPAPGLARMVAPKFREVMARFLGASGISRESAPFVEAHFYRMCAALEAHFAGPRGARFLLATPHPTLADVVLGAAFSAGFLRDEPPAARVFEAYPNLAAYVERTTGWRGGGDGGFVGDAAASPEDAAADEDAAYPDEVPESLSAFFENMIEVLPFLVAQCAAFRAYMSSDAVRSLRREPLEEPWKGCHGYLLPQLTNIRSLMIIDNSIFNVQARAQDLEIAFLASREVCDETLGDFNRLDRAVATEAAAAVNDPRLKDEASNPDPSASHDTIALDPRQGLPELPNKPPSAPYDNDENEEGPDRGLTEAETPLEGLGRRGRRFFTTSDLKDLDLDPDSADFYRVFTEQGARSQRSVRLQKPSSTLGDLSRSGVSPDKAAVGLRSSVNDHLDLIRSIMSKMQCPQYTLSTVFHGRRVYVAAIPEHEVDKIRRQKS